MTEEYKSRKIAYIKKYQKKTYANVSIKLRLDTDTDVLEKLESVPNKSDYIKLLIRTDIYGKI